MNVVLLTEKRSLTQFHCGPNFPPGPFSLLPILRSLTHTYWIFGDYKAFIAVISSLPLSPLLNLYLGFDHTRKTVPAVEVLVKENSFLHLFLRQTRLQEQHYVAKPTFEDENLYNILQYF